jgi:alpha-1,2-mannosyltransferase
VAGAVALLVRMLPGERDWRTWALVPLLACTSMPFIQAITHGQNTCVSLLLLCAAVTAWRKQRDALAGVLCGLMFYKPQLAAVVAVMLVLDRGPRALLWLCGTLAAIFVLTAITMPGAISDYAHRLPLNSRAIQIDRTYLWERHVTLLAMWRLLLQGRVPGEAATLVTVLTWVSCGAIAAGLLRAARRTRRAATADDAFTGETKFIRRDRLIAATVASTPLVMPFYFDYDLLLLSVPAVLFAGGVMMRAPGAPRERFDDATRFAWVALFGWTMINASLAGASGLNVVVAILTILAALLIRRASREVEVSCLLIRRPHVIPVSARRAA